jgi:hypothetical protein
MTCLIGAYVFLIAYGIPSMLEGTFLYTISPILVATLQPICNDQSGTIYLIS